MTTKTLNPGNKPRNKPNQDGYALLSMVAALILAGLTFTGVVAGIASLAKYTGDLKKELISGIEERNAHVREQHTVFEAD